MGLQIENWNNIQGIKYERSHIITYMTVPLMPEVIMEDRNHEKSHRLSLGNRRSGSLTGIRKVISFDPEMVVLETEQGNLTVKGHEMHVTRLDVDKGELEFSGTVDSMTYSEPRSAGHVTSGILKRMFK